MYPWVHTQSMISEGANTMRNDTSRHIPNNALPIHEPGLGTVYVYPFAGRYGVIAYRDKAFRSDFHYTYKTDAEVDRKIEEFFNSIRQHKQAVANRRVEYNKPHTFKVGEIVTNSWGYDQTNVDWYRVSRVSTHYVWLVPVCASLETAEGCAPMSGNESVTLDENLKPVDATNAKETKHKATGDYVSMKHGSGSRYTGGSLHSSWYA